MGPARAGQRSGSRWGRGTDQGVKWGPRRRPSGKTSRPRRGQHRVRGALSVSAPMTVRHWSYIGAPRRPRSSIKPLPWSLWRRRSASGSARGVAPLHDGVQPSGRKWKCDAQRGRVYDVLHFVLRGRVYASGGIRAKSKDVLHIRRHRASLATFLTASVGANIKASPSPPIVGL